MFDELDDERMRVDQPETDIDMVERFLNGLSNSN